MVLIGKDEIVAVITKMEMEMGVVYIGEGKYMKLVEHEVPPENMNKKPMPKMELVQNYE